MNIVRAHARTGYFFDFDNNSDKYYRVIQAGPYTIFNWGRVGGPIGQLDIKKHPSEAAARTALEKKWEDKTGPRARDRYGKPEQHEFDLDLDRLSPDKFSAVQAIHVYLAATRSRSERGPDLGTPDAIRPRVEDRIAALTQRALDVIELAVSQPQEAFASFADLNEEWAQLQEEVEKVKGYVQTADAMVAQV